MRGLVSCGQPWRAALRRMDASPPWGMAGAVRCYAAPRGTLVVIVTPQGDFAAVMVVNSKAGWHALVDAISMPTQTCPQHHRRKWAMGAGGMLRGSRH